MHEKIKDLLKSLGFKGMLRYFEEILDLKKTDEETWLKIFCSLLEQEKAYRQTRSFAYRLSLSKMPQIRSLDNFDITGLPIKHDVFEKTKDMQFIDDLGLAHKALQEKYRVRFFKFADLARKLIQAKTHNYEDNFMRRLLRFNLLVIDEFGYLPVDPAAGSLLFELFSNLYENVSVILTTHLVFEEWADIFGNKKSTKAIIDRFIHHCLVLETGNKSWRLQGKNTQEKNKCVKNDPKIGSSKKFNDNR
jgi:DNA replication protein DnaC